ncbi:DNA gyrase inhibitor YacG [Rubellimicrobium sp. CFH 75288]|nr:DNA gyrase inhibitor YacG [Rubellimicrobium sp. CFH 75288]NAZ37118.1 DNA gyrase inhibitor YacG [Rubellimicrobium sp. CFH 75288]
MACPLCGRATEPRWRPFCSARCADLDLARWLRGDYRIPAEAAEEPERPAPPAEPDER